MKRRFLIVLLVALLPIFLNAEGSEKKAFMIYGEDFMITPSLPESWMVDMNVAQQYQINGFFYLKEYGINKSPAIIILNLYGRDSFKNFEDYVKAYSDNLIEYYKDYDVKKLNAETFENKTNKCNLVLYEMRSKDGNGHYQQIAYLDTGNKYLVEMYIDCKSEKNNTVFVNDFIDCVYSISYMDANVKEKKGKRK